MKVGDLVKRRVTHGLTALCGIVVSKRMAGIPEHPCVTVFFSNGSTYDMAESILEVISEGD